MEDEVKNKKSEDVPCGVVLDDADGDCLLTEDGEVIVTEAGEPIKKEDQNG